MNNVFYLKALADPSTAPCLVLVDMQREYIAGPRLISLQGAKTALKNCRRALDYARGNGLPIVFLRLISQSAFFNRATEFVAWIDGFEPLRSEMVFERSQPSAYANSRFAEFMNICRGHFILAGFAGETSCLATAIEAYHRGHPFCFLSDASASHPISELSADNTHDAVTKIISLYGEVLNTKSWIKDHQGLDSHVIKRLIRPLGQVSDD